MLRTLARVVTAVDHPVEDGVVGLAAMRASAIGHIARETPPLQCPRGVAAYTGKGRLLLRLEG